MPTINAIIRKRVMDLEFEVEWMKKRLKLIEQTFPWDLKRVSIDLPDHLRHTYEILQSEPRTAQEVSEITKRKRAVESSYLNQLVIMKLAEKHRNKRKVIFKVIVGGR